MGADPELVEQTEPVRKSFLDILRKNLEIVERVSQIITNNKIISY